MSADRSDRRSECVLGDLQASGSKVTESENRRKAQVAGEAGSSAAVRHAAARPSLPDLACWRAARSTGPRPHRATASTHPAGGWSRRVVSAHRCSPLTAATGPCQPCRRACQLPATAHKTLLRPTSPAARQSTGDRRRCGSCRDGWAYCQHALWRERLARWEATADGGGVSSKQRPASGKASSCGNTNCRGTVTMPASAFAAVTHEGKNADAYRRAWHPC